MADVADGAGAADRAADDPGPLASSAVWRVEHLADAASELHARAVPGGGGRTVWVMHPARPAIVLGSTQDPLDATTRAGFDVVVRRSGGGAVFVDPERSVWIDVVIPRDDPRWDRDVNRSFGWIGEVWATAIRAVLPPDELEPGSLAVHGDGLVRTPWSRLVCFAGLGPGEVTIDGRKVVGLSQRRTREAARFQSIAYLDDAGAGRVVDALVEPADETERAALRAHLAASVRGVPTDASRLVAAFLSALPAT
jgi:lipoate-protein ligase A